MDLDFGTTPEGKPCIILRPDHFGNPELMTHKDALRMAVKLIEMADRIKSPPIKSEWP